MLVSIIAGSDKTVVSVATGHQEFHPVYVSPGNIDNPTHHTHGIGFLPCAFLPIPKGTVSHSIFCHQLPKLTSLQASESEWKSIVFQQFC
jgi:Plavaka transposase